MPAYQFRSGQVVYAKGGPFSAMPPGQYVIVRHLPPTLRNENQYRIKSLQDGHERNVKEAELTAEPS